MDPNERVATLADKIRHLPGFPTFPGVEPGGARYDHMGALLSDAALQATIDFDSVVKPRVDKLLVTWPDAVTVDRFRARVAAENLCAVLDCNHPERLARALRLADLLATEGVQTVPDLHEWCLRSDSRTKLLKLQAWARRPPTTSRSWRADRRSLSTAAFVPSSAQAPTTRSAIFSLASPPSSSSTSAYWTGWRGRRG